MNEIFQLIWCSLSKIQINWEILTNFCGLLRKTELYFSCWRYSYFSLFIAVSPFWGKNLWFIKTLKFRVYIHMHYALVVECLIFSWITTYLYKIDDHFSFRICIFIEHDVWLREKFPPIYWSKNVSCYLETAFLWSRFHGIDDIFVELFAEIFPLTMTPIVTYSVHIGFK